MANPLLDGMKAAVNKARMKKDMYLQAAKDLSRVPGDASDVMTYKPAREGFDKAKAARNRSRMK